MLTSSNYVKEEKIAKHNHERQTAQDTLLKNGSDHPYLFSVLCVYFAQGQKKLSSVSQALFRTFEKTNVSAAAKHFSQILLKQNIV